MNNDMQLPKSALDHHTAVLGKTGSGKTSIAKAAIVEPALRAGEHIATLDPTGAWWGLRLRADGRSKGYPVYVFGGRHADYPLLAGHGETMAEVIGTTNTPAILDTSLMKNSERMRFFTDFADALLRKNEAPLRLIIDEAHLFMPQAGTRGSGAMPDMLHAGNNLISLGRSRGLRVTLISQRAAKLHKDSLTQVETLIALRLIAPQDRAAVREWIADQADIEKGKEIIASLPRLADGEGWVWSPEADFLKRIQFPRPETYDSSAAPASSAKATKLPPVDLKALERRLAKVDDEAKANDPKALRVELAKLRKEKAALERQLASPPASPDGEALAAAERRGFAQAEKNLKAAMLHDLRSALTARLTIIREDAQKLLNAVTNELSAAKVEHAALSVEYSADPSVFIASPAGFDALDAPPGSIANVAQPERHTVGALSRAMQKVLDAVAWWRKIGMEPVARARACVVAGYSPKASTFGVHAAALIKSGHLIAEQGGLRLTELGLTMANIPAAASREESRTMGCALLRPQEARVFDVVYNAYPQPIRRDDVAAAVGLSPTASTVSVYIAVVAAYGLIESAGKGEVRAAGWLFP